LSRSERAQAAAGWMVIAIVVGWTLLWFGLGILVGATS
jgi:hypothetical protein